MFPLLYWGWLKTKSYFCFIPRYSNHEKTNLYATGRYILASAAVEIANHTSPCAIYCSQNSSLILQKSWSQNTNNSTVTSFLVILISLISHFLHLQNACNYVFYATYCHHKFCLYVRLLATNFISFMSLSAWYESLHKKAVCGRCLYVFPWFSPTGTPTFSLLFVSLFFFSFCLPTSPSTPLSILST